MERIFAAFGCDAIDQAFELNDKKLEECMVTKNTDFQALEPHLSKGSEVEVLELKPIMDDRQASISSSPPQRFSFL